MSDFLRTSYTNFRNRTAKFNVCETILNSLCCFVFTCLTIDSSPRLISNEKSPVIANWFRPFLFTLNVFGSKTPAPMLYGSNDRITTSYDFCNKIRFSILKSRNFDFSFNYITSAVRVGWYFISKIEYATKMVKCILLLRLVLRVCCCLRRSAIQLTRWIIKFVCKVWFNEEFVFVCEKAYFAEQIFFRNM